MNLRNTALGGALGFYLVAQRAYADHLNSGGRAVLSQFWDNLDGHPFTLAVLVVTWGSLFLFLALAVWFRGRDAVVEKRNAPMRTPLSATEGGNRGGSALSAVQKPLSGGIWWSYERALAARRQSRLPENLRRAALRAGWLFALCLLTFLAPVLLFLSGIPKQFREDFNKDLR